jgi:hypothetical protein
MKKKVAILVGSTIVLATILLTILGFCVKEETTANPNVNYSSIYIHCDGCGTGDYADVLWAGYTLNCEGYTPEWSGDEGRLYFDSNGYITHTLNDHVQLCIFGVDLTITKIGAQCQYHEEKWEGDTCNNSTQSVSFDIEYPWNCPDR